MSTPCLGIITTSYRRRRSVSPLDSTMAMVSTIAITRIDAGFQLQSPYSLTTSATAARALTGTARSTQLEINNLVTSKVSRQEFGKDQLRQVMIDFWSNHFYVFAGNNYRATFVHDALCTTLLRNPLPRAIIDLYSTGVEP